MSRSLGEYREHLETLDYPVQKDETDMHLAYLEGRKRNYSEFRIYGGTGGREDHTYANLSLLLYAKEMGNNATLYGEKNISTVIKNEEKCFTGRDMMHFSAFAIGGAANGVSIKGLEYECEDITLTPSFPLAVSNRFTGREATVSVKDGALLIMIEI